MKIAQEILIFLGAFAICYIAEKLDIYNIYIIYMLVRIMVRVRELENK